MEIRVLEYFMEIAREGSMTRAAERLFVSQPTLSKQMKELEKELGIKLFKRGSTSVTLTDEGMLLRKRAEDILAMVDKTKSEFSSLGEITGGEVYIGCAESYLISYLADKIKGFKELYPNLRFHIISGGTEQVAERLDRGLLDFAVICELPDLSKYNFIEIPGVNVWGLVVRKDSPLAQKEQITFDDLSDVELICSEQSVKADLPRWCGENVDKLRFSGFTNLFYNGTIFVEQGLGAMLTFDRLAYTGVGSSLAFVPLNPRLETRLFLIWKKYQVFTPIAQLLLDELKE